MKRNMLVSDDDKLLFQDSVQGVKKLKQDRVVHKKKPLIHNQAEPDKRLRQEQEDASFYFSDQYQPLLSDEGPVRYCRANFDSYEVKKLRRGDYSPELFLDLHGLTQQQAKQELGALIAACQREHVKCACVMHGHGKHILKKQTPMWLAQHPAILAFHQAPKEFGGDAALLLLIELND